MNMPSTRMHQVTSSGQVPTISLPTKLARVHGSEISDAVSMAATFTRDSDKKIFKILIAELQVPQVRVFLDKGEWNSKLLCLLRRKKALST